MTKEIKIAVGVGVGILAIGTALFIAQPEDHEGMTQKKTEMPNVLEVSERLHDFGTISMKNGKVTSVFTVKNQDIEPRILTKLYTSCMCTSALLKLSGSTEGPFGMPGHGALKTFRQQLPAGGEANIEVIFDPNAHGPAGVGVIERDITLEDSRGVVATMRIKANVTP